MAQTTNDIKNGSVLNLDGQLWTVTKFQHVKPGKGPAFVRTTIKNVLSGKIVDKTFNAGMKMEFETVDNRNLQYSYEDGDQWFEWAPDGKSLLVQFVDRNRWSQEVGLVPADGSGKLRNLTHSGYEDFHPVFARQGQMVIWASDRQGLHGNGGGARSDVDVFGMFLTRAAFDRYQVPWQRTLDELHEAGKLASAAPPVRLLLFGMLNWSSHWYRADGELSIDALADAAAAMLLNQAEKKGAAR